MGIKYRAAKGEIIFAMVTCRPDISYAVIKLAQFNNAPAEIHYKAILDIYNYLKATKAHSIQCWRPCYNTKLPKTNALGPEPEQYEVNTSEDHNTLN